MRLLQRHNPPKSSSRNSLSRYGRQATVYVSGVIIMNSTNIQLTNYHILVSFLPNPLFFLLLQFGHFGVLGLLSSNRFSIPALFNKLILPKRSCRLIHFWISEMKCKIPLWILGSGVGLFPQKGTLTRHINRSYEQQCLFTSQLAFPLC